jgi:hypothetical protein
MAVALLPGLISLGGCNLLSVTRNPASAGCGDSITISPVAATQTVDSIRRETLARAARNPRRTVQANLVADFGRGPTGSRTRIDVSVIARADGTFARLRTTAESTVPVVDVLLDGNEFSVVNHQDRQVLRGVNPTRGSDRAPMVPLARAMVQVLDPESALAARFAREPRPALEHRAGEYILTFGRPDGRQEIWHLRQRDLLPTKFALREGQAITSEIRVTGYKDASDASGPVPTCASLLIDPGVDLSIRMGTVRRNIPIPAAARQQERPGSYRTLNL